MIRWFRGQLEASYVGEDSKAAAHGRAYAGKQFQPRVYRAAVRQLSFIAPPSDAQPPELEAPEPPPDASGVQIAVNAHTLAPASEAPATRPGATVFRQRRIDEAHVAEARGPGTFYMGPLFDVRVADVLLTHPIEKNGRPYGRMVGDIVGCFVLPDVPAPERVPATKLVESDAPAPAGELHVERARTAEGSPGADAEDLALDVHASAEAVDAAQAEPTTLAARFSTGLSLLSVALLVAVALGVHGGLTPVGLWCLFVLPTLVARRMLRGVLPEGRAVQLMGAALVLVNVVCTSALLTHAWSADCKELALGPLLGVVMVLFPAGVLPSVLPLVCNAAGLALVLFSWCSG